MAGRARGLNGSRRGLRIAAALVLVACGVAARHAVPDEGVLRIRNDSAVPWTLWMYSAEDKQWLKPKFLPREQAVAIDLSSRGDVFLVLCDEADREFQLRWMDLHAAVRQLATPPDGVAEIALTTVVQTRTVEEPVTLTVPVEEQVTRTVVVDGQTKEIVETVTRMVEVTETRLVEYTVEVPALRSERAGEPVSLDDFAVDRPPPPPRPVEEAPDRE